MAANTAGFIWMVYSDLHADGTPDIRIAPHESDRHIAAYKAQGYQVVDYDTFMDAWAERDWYAHEQRYLAVLRRRAAERQVPADGPLPRGMYHYDDR